MSRLLFAFALAALIPCLAVAGKHSKKHRTPASAFDDKALQESLGVTEHYLTVGDVKIHYVEKGEGKPVLFIHGFPDFWYSWRHVASRFPSGYRLILLDMPGYNKSDKPKNVDAYQIGRIATLTADFIRSLQLGKVTVVAQDWGGSVAWTLAHQNPELLDKLVVMNNPHPLSLGRLNDAEKAAFSKAIAYITLFRMPGVAEEKLRANDGAVLRGFFAKGKFTPDEVDTFMGAISQPDALTGGLNYYRANEAYTKFTGITDLNPAIGQPLSVKTLVLWGDGDPVMVPVLADYTKEFLPAGSEVYHLSDCGHFPQTDQPEIVTQKISAFLGNP